MRRRIAIAILIALGGAVWAGAHWATHRAVAGEPFATPHDAHDPSHAAQTGTGYLSTSLTLCLALALVLAATAALGHRSRSSRGRSLWLFGVVPVLGLLVEVLASPTHAGIAGSLVEVAPLALVSLVVQVAVALVALRLAHGILHLAEAVARAVVGTESATLEDGLLLLAVERSDRAPSSRLSYAGSQRAPPALQPAF